jgi:D-threonate/D-erythronate kinase
VNQNPNHTVLIIADDLTGAADSTTAFARQGFRTRVVVDPVDWSATSLNDYDVVAFNTETRNLEADESAAIVRTLARKLADMKPRLILKKIDSTFRGHVLVETAAVLNELGLERAVISSAHPAQKRVVSRSAIYVDGIPLRDTTYARHRSPPPRDIPAAAREVFENSLIFSGLSTEHLPETPPAGIYLPDCLHEEDLTRTARWVIAQGAGILPVGSGAMAHAFARFLIPPIRAEINRPPNVDPDQNKLLIVIGSTQQTVNNQIQMLSSTRPDVAVVSAANGNRIDVDINALEAPIIVLRIVGGTTLIGHEEACGNLAETTNLIMDSQPVAHLVTVGGDTSSAVLRSLDIKGFDVSADDIADLPRGDTWYAGHPMTYIAKPAGFSKSSILAEIAETLVPRRKDTPS